MKLTLENVRIAFIDNLFEPGVYTAPGRPPSNPRYSCKFVFPPNSPAHQKALASIKQMCRDLWQEKAAAYYKAMVTQDHLCLHDGDVKLKWKGFPGNWFISAGNKNKPKAVGRTRQILTGNEGLIHAGCYVNGIVELWYDARDGGKINASLLAVQYIGPGEEVWGGSTSINVDEEFEKLEADDTAFDSESDGSELFGDDEISF